MADDGIEAVHTELADLRGDASHDLGLLWSSLRLGFEAVEHVLAELRLGMAHLDDRCTAAGDEALALRRAAEEQYAVFKRRLDEVVAGDAGTDLLERQEAVEAQVAKLAREIDTLRATTHAIPALSRGIDELRSVGDLGALTRRMDAVEAEARGAASTAAGNPVPPPEDEWEFSSLEAWVEDFFVLTVERRLTNTRRWCSRWAEHDEARARLQALWQSWEQSRARTDPLALSTWYLDHLDRHLTVLLSAEGPFAGCSPQRHNARPPLHARPVENTETITRWDDVEPLDEDRTQEVRIP